MRVLALAALCGLLSWSASPAFAESAGLVPASDLRAEASRAARQGNPLVILFSRKDCRYCEQVRRDYLIPLANRTREPIIVRQVDQDSQAALTGFNGEASSHAAFASQQRVRLVPVVAFYGPDGRMLAPAIVGVRLPDFYQGYLDEALEKARARLVRSGP